MKYWFEAWSV